MQKEVDILNEEGIEKECHLSQRHRIIKNNLFKKLLCALMCFPLSTAF